MNILRCSIKSFIVGLLVGLVAIFILGATSSGNEGVYQLSMTAQRGVVIYGRVHTGTGKIETWKFRVESKAIPLLGDNPRMLHGPDSGK